MNAPSILWTYQKQLAEKGTSPQKGKFQKSGIISGVFFGFGISALITFLNANSGTSGDLFEDATTMIIMFPVMICCFLIGAAFGLSTIIKFISDKSEDKNSSVKVVTYSLTEKDAMVKVQGKTAKISLLDLVYAEINENPSYEFGIVDLRLLGKGRNCIFKSVPLNEAEKALAILHNLYPNLAEK
ncbi:MAG: hypothetical protein GY810_04050 [Aureispira sp.]|nr:hypothetical protein [Aureispira sp.]